MTREKGVGGWGKEWPVEGQASMAKGVSRVHVFGASGSGVSTLGRAVAERCGLAFIDNDDVFWEETDPPYQRAKGLEERQRLLRERLAGHAGWVLAGSMCGWGDFVIPWIELAVFVLTPQGMRIERLRNRERLRFGARLGAGGDMQAQHAAFLKWAEQYEEGPMEMRSRRLHEEWIRGLKCPVMRVDGGRGVAVLCEEVVERMRGMGAGGRGGG